MDLGDATPQPGGLLHLGEFVGQEQHLAVTGAGHQRVLGIAGVLNHKTRIVHFLLAAHALQVGVPALAIGRIREHEIKLPRRKAVVGQG